MSKTKFLILYFLFVSSLSFSINNINLKIFSSEDGLINNNVNCIKEDKNGFIWFFTDNGMSRYDGIGFTNYRSSYITPKLFSSNQIKSAEIDSLGRFWLLTEKGIDIFCPYTQKVEKNVIPEISGFVINKLIFLGDNQVYIGTSNGIYVYDKVKHILKKKDVIYNYIRTLYKDSSDNIWIGTWGNGFLYWDIAKDEIINWGEIFDYNKSNVTDFIEDNNHRVWITTWDTSGIICLKKDSINGYEKVDFDSTAIKATVHYNLEYDKIKDVLWFSSADGLSYIDLNNENLKALSLDSRVKTKEVRYVYKDRNNNLWLSLIGLGIYKLNYVIDSFETLPLLSKSQIVTSLFEYNDSILWVGVRQSILYKYNIHSKIYTHCSKDSILHNIPERANAVTSVFRSSVDSSIWLGTRYRGVFIVDEKATGKRKFSRPKQKFERYKDVVSSITEDCKGRIWVGTESGLKSYQLFGNGEWGDCSSKLIPDNLLKQNIVTLVSQDSILWIGTNDNGIWKVDINSKELSNNYKQYSLNDKSLPFDFISSFTVDSNNKLWVGFKSGGICYYDSELDKFLIFEDNELLPNNTIYSLLEDCNKKIWIATGSGLASIDLNNRDNIRNYCKDDGLNNSSFLHSSLLLHSTGSVFIGGVNGLEVYSEQNDSNRYVDIDCHINNISILDIPFSKCNKSDTISTYINRIELKHSEKNIMFTLGNNDYRDLKSIKYAYRMLGLNNNWSYLDSNNRSISFNNLKSGDYIFEAKVLNNSGNWSKVRQVYISVSVSPWKTTWAYAVYILLLLLTISGIYWVTIERIKNKNELRYSRLEVLKTKELNDAKLKFFTNISHDLFTPLSVINCGLESMKRKNEEEQEILVIMQNNLKRLQRLLQQILEFRKAETGNLKLKVSKGDIVLFVRDICYNNFTLLLKNKNIHIDFISNIESKVCWFDIDKLDKILYNLLSNAYKYNIENGWIKVIIEDADKFINIKIINTGLGISNENKKHLFKRFYEGDYRKFNTNGTGIGLSLTKDLVTLHKGTIEVESEIDKETCFTIIIPICKDSYEKDQIDEVIIREDSPNVKIQKRIDSFEFESKPVVLLVEDDLDLLSVVKSNLSFYFEIHTANNGIEALKLLENNKTVDFIITDYLMPQMNGIELCQHVRRDITISHIPILMLTARSHSEDKLEGFMAGADAYVTKPFDTEILIAQVLSILENRKNIFKKYKANGAIVELKEEFKLGSLDNEFLQKAISLVEENISIMDFTNEQFCQMMSMTQSTLYRKMKSLTGFSPNEFIRDIKIKKACELLQDSSMRISDVAYSVGYNDPKYFSIIFKKVKNMSPSDYVESIK